MPQLVLFISSYLGTLGGKYELLPGALGLEWSAFECCCSSRKLYTRERNFWASSARSLAIWGFISARCLKGYLLIWGSRFAVSIVRLAHCLLFISTSRVGFENMACEANRFRRIRASLISKYLQETIILHEILIIHHRQLSCLQN